MISKRLISLFGALAVLTASTQTSAETIPAKVPDEVDDMACFVFLDLYILLTEERLKDGKVEEKDRLSVIGYVKHWRDARGFYEGRLSAQSPDQLAKDGQAVIDRMKKAPQGEVAGVTIDCLKYYDARHKSIIKPIYGAADDK